MRDRLAAEDALMRQVEPLLDPGIVAAVRILRSAGIETYESCQGGEGHSFPEPTVRFNGSRGEAMMALGAAFTHGPEIGLAVFELRRVWRVDDGDLTGPWWDLVFRPGNRSGQD